MMNNAHGTQTRLVSAGYCRRLLLFAPCSLFLLLWCSSGIPLRAQIPAPVTIPSGKFLTDSFEIGRPFRYALSFRHPVNEDVLFPDSTAFSPFLVRDKTFLPTRSDAQISTDSAVYTLVSFETDSLLTLRVPLYIVGATDCTVVFSSIDTVFFLSRLQTTRPDTLQLQTITQINPLRRELNYPLLGVVLGSLGLVAGLIYALFGRFIIRRFTLFQLRQRHLAFLREYDRIIQTLRPESAEEGAYQAIVRWKNYLQQLEQQPFASMTTPEIVERITMREVALPGVRGRAVLEALRTADRMIYGGAYTDQSAASLELLRVVAVAIYDQRRALILKLGVPVTSQPLVES